MFLQADLEDQVVMLKGKRTKRPRPPSSLELTTMAPTTSSSSTATAAAAGGGGVTSDEVSDRTTPSLSDSGELTHDEEQDMANCLILLARGQRQRMPLPPQPPPPAAAAMDVYQCKTCDKSFSSFQALGGHRASHKKPSSKPITITAVDEYYQRSIQISDNNNNNNSNIYLGNQTRHKSTTTTRRVHECSLCGAEFASGQALGGHMRRHRPIPAASISGSGHGDQHPEVKRQRNMLLSLDLNLPAAPEEEQPAAAVAAESKFPFAPKEQVIVFSATPLVDCHY